MIYFSRRMSMGAMLLICLITFGMSHAQLPAKNTRCWLDMTHRAMPDRQQCMVSFKTPEGAVDELFEQVKHFTAKSQFNEADRALDCIEAIIVTDGESLDRHSLVRHRGVLEYRREHVPQALSHFECALSISRATGNDELIAHDLNSVGSALRRLGDYRGALGHLNESLQHLRHIGGRSAAVSNNIGDVYRDLNDLDESLRNYREAERLYLERGEKVQAAHVEESMAVVQLALGQAEIAEEVFEQALTTYREAGQHDYVLRIKGLLIRAVLAQGNIERAAYWLASGEAVAEANKLALPFTFVLQAARTERLLGARSAAEHRLRMALSQFKGSGAERAELLTELATTQEAQGNLHDALISLRSAREEERLDAEARHDRALGWLRTRFELSERDRIIENLAVENRLRQADLQKRTLIFGLVGLAVVVLLLIIGLVFLRIRQKERQAQAVALARKEEEIARYRREANSLCEDRAGLQSLLDTRPEALILLNADGVIMAANRAAYAVLPAQAESQGVGIVISELAHVDDQFLLRDALDKMEEGGVEPIRARFRYDTPLQVRLSAWAEGDGLLVMELSDPVDAHSILISEQEGPSEIVADGFNVGSGQITAADGGMPEINMDAEALNDEERRLLFRRLLVELMLETIDCWERCTQQNRLDLAETSKIWRVAIDDGRLRARSMERYLNINRLPQKPRWRDVLRTTYFVLEKCALDEGTRESLQARVDSVLAYTRRRALV